MIAKRSNWICEAVFSYPEDNRLSAKTLIELADRYNKLIDDKAELEQKNREKTYEVMCQQEHSR